MTYEQLSFDFMEEYRSKAVWRPRFPLTPEQYERLQEVKKKYDRLLQPQIDALERCSRITGEDLAITINSIYK